MENHPLQEKSLAQAVYDLVKTIPPGQVTTYGQIACHLGNPHLARAVGNALHKNPEPHTIPCHRVVNSKGEVSSAFAFGGSPAQRQLLEAEGVVFNQRGRVDLEQYGVEWEAGE